MLIFRLFVLLLSFPLGATVFVPQSVDQQIKEADGVMIGHFLKQQTIKLDNGQLATQMVFKMNKEQGLQSELFGMDELIVHYPGGELDGMTVKVEGVPRFVPGEHVVLMIKNYQDRYWGLNLGFGTFKVVNYGKGPLLVNTIFPEDSRVGQISLNDFEKKVRFIKGGSLKVVHAPLYQTEEDNYDSRAPASIEEEGKNRAIASDTDQEENIQEQSQFNTLWLLGFLAMLGGIFRFTRQREAK